VRTGPVDSLELSRLNAEFIVCVCGRVVYLCNFSLATIGSLFVPTLPAALQRRPKLLLLTFTVSVLLAVAALQIVSLWWRRDMILSGAEARAANLSYVLSEYVRGSFALADTSLRQLAIHARRVGGPDAPAEAWDAMLLSAKAAVPGGGALSVTDARGIIRRATVPILGQSRSDYYLFKHLAALDRDELVVDRPFVSNLAPNRILIPIGRRLVDDKGRFAGTVVATVMPEAFREFFRTIDVGEAGIISVFHPDGVVLLREPADPDGIGAPATSNPVLQAAQRSGSDGVTTGRLQAGGPTYVSAYRQTAGTPPLIVAVSLSEGEILADWQRQVQTSLAAFTALTLTLALMLRVLFRQMRARSKAEKDLTEVQRLEAERLRQSNERLEEALEREQRARLETEAASYLKDEFLMTVSHELRTPLTAIYGWVRMLATEGLRGDQRRRAIAAVERNARAQTRLIDDLLDVSRAISGKLRLEARPVNVADVVHAAVETLGSALEAKSIRLDSTIDAHIGPVVVDPDRVQQIVWNLLSNAIKFTPDHGTIRLSLRRTESSIEICVEDTGVGIDPDFLPYVFERFRQAEAGTRRRYGGLGLGLAIVRHLVELHGGTVAAQSGGDGAGARFRVLLPMRVARADSEPAMVSTPSAPLEALEARLDGLRVLVVDDEADARELFASIVERAGASVLTAPSAQDALRILADGSIQILLSDIEMPGEDGYELIAQVLANPQIPRPIAIAVTAYARSVDRRRALDAGFDRHLAKPIEPAELVAVIASLTAQQLARRT
jgi:signal transduction histidine kinase/ActR/RegA family two-component response regulator